MYRQFEVALLYRMLIIICCSMSQLMGVYHFFML